MRALIVGGGIGGLTTALSLHAAGIDSQVIEAASSLRPLGVGINLQPHAVRELTELGLGDELAATGIPTSFMTFTDRFGGVIIALPRGRSAGYLWPQYSIHRGELQTMLLKAVLDRMGGSSVRTAVTFQDFSQDAEGVTVALRSGGQVTHERFDVVIGADGIHSAVRARLHPSRDDLQGCGIHMWRGAVEGEPFMDDGTVLVAGSNATAKFVAYPISARARARGRALINWVAEVKMAEPGPVRDADWDRQGRLEDVIGHFAGWKHALLDIPAVIEGTERILSYPMVDKDPLDSWGQGRVTLLGDAAHPVYPIGSNGGSQAVLDARVLARCLAAADTPFDGLARYEAERREVTNALVLGHRTLPMEATIRLVTERAPGGFDDIAHVLTPQELADMAEAQRRITDIDVDELNHRASWSV